MKRSKKKSKQSGLPPRLPKSMTETSHGASCTNFDKVLALQALCVHTVTGCAA